MCWNNVREFCGGIGFKTKIGSRNQLAQRLEVIRTNRFSLRNFIQSPKYRSWFRQSHRGLSEDNTLGSLKFQPIASPLWNYNQDQVLLRFAGREVLSEWKRDGTTVVRGAMAWLFEDEVLRELIKEEVLLYTYYRRLVNGRPNLGWLRSAYHTQIQQISQQDPVYYALMAATNPNKTWKQVSYLYYIKAVLPGDGIYFQHLDLNTKRYVECGRRKNRIQTSLTLNHERVKNCTKVIPGFHTRILEWWQDIVKKGEAELTGKFGSALDDNGNTLKTDDIYTSADAKKYGKFVPVVCGPGDIRISRPEILHRSTSNKQGIVESNWRVVNPWFVSIQDDHETLDVSESGNWSSVHATHRDLNVTNGIPSGQINTHSFPLYCFPAVVAMGNISALSDVLGGQQRWDDPEVVIEWNWLLGADTDMSWKFVEHCQRRFKRAYK